jgi:hypothetical protein
MDLRLLGRELRDNSPETQCIFAEPRSHEIVTGCGRVTFVEDEVYDLEHRREALSELDAARNYKWDPALGERPLGADDSLRDRRLRNEKGTSDLVGSQAA